MASGLVAGEDHAGARGGAVDEAKGCCWTALREQPTTSPKDDRGDGQQVLVLGTGRRLFDSRRPVPRTSTCCPSPRSSLGLVVGCSRRAVQQHPFASSTAPPRAPA